MTVSTAPYYHWSSRSDSEVAPYNACSPNLVSLQDYYRRRWGAVSLGCHVQRAVSGGSTLSSHAWGAACDPKFPDRTATVQAMEWTISFSKELGVNTIHDYIRQMMWKPLQGWVSASIGSVGGAWIHVETTPAAFGDGRPVEDKLPGSGQGGDDFMTPEDQKYLDGKFAQLVKDVWNYPTGDDSGVPSDSTVHRLNYSAIRVFDTILPQLDALIAKVDALALTAGDADALKAAVAEIVRNVLNDTVLEVRPPS